MVKLKLQFRVFKIETLSSNFFLNKYDEFYALFNLKEKVKGNFHINSIITEELLFNSKINL